MWSVWTDASHSLQFAEKLYDYLDHKPKIKIKIGNTSLKEIDYMERFSWTYSVRNSLSIESDIIAIIVRNELDDEMLWNSRGISVHAFEFS